MTKSMLYSMTNRKPYIQSPIDDLFSFFYVGQWAVVYNAETDSRKLQDLRRQLQVPRSQHYAFDSHFYDYIRARDEATSDIASGYTGTYSPFLKPSVHILREWMPPLVQLERAWATVELQAQAEGLTGKEANYFFVPHFYKFALRGVVLYLRLLLKHRDELQVQM